MRPVKAAHRRSTSATTTLSSLDQSNTMGLIHRARRGPACWVSLPLLRSRDLLQVYIVCSIACDILCSVRIFLLTEEHRSSYLLHYLSSNNVLSTWSVELQSAANGGLHSPTINRCAVPRLMVQYISGYIYVSNLTQRPVIMEARARASQTPSIAKRLQPSSATDIPDEVWSRVFSVSSIAVML